jgi:hypothetical protein
MSPFSASDVVDAPNVVTGVIVFPFFDETKLPAATKDPGADDADCMIAPLEVEVNPAA